MENQELIKQVTEKAEKWLTPAYDAETQAEVKRMLENEDKTELIEAFYKDLEFGTGGLRGIMGVGSNRMNIYTVQPFQIQDRGFRIQRKRRRFSIYDLLPFN